MLSVGLELDPHLTFSCFYFGLCLDPVWSCEEGESFSSRRIKQQESFSEPIFIFLKTKNFALWWIWVTDDHVWSSEGSHGHNKHSDTQNKLYTALAPNSGTKVAMVTAVASLSRRILSIYVSEKTNSELGELILLLLLLLSARSGQNHGFTGPAFINLLTQQISRRHRVSAHLAKNEDLPLKSKTWQ